MKIIPVWALLPHRPGNKINLQSRDQPLSIQFEIITNISSSQQNDVRKILQNICEQEKSYSLSKSSFSVLLLLISTLSLKLKLQLLFCSELPISPYIFHQPKYWAYRKVIFRVSSALKSFYHLAHLCFWMPNKLKQHKHSIYLTPDQFDPSKDKEWAFGPFFVYFLMFHYCTRFKSAKRARPLLSLL